MNKQHNNSQRERAPTLCLQTIKFDTMLLHENERKQASNRERKNEQVEWKKKYKSAACQQQNK